MRRRHVAPTTSTASADRSPAELAAHATLIATATASRAALLGAGDVRPGSHVAPAERDRAIEIGAFCAAPIAYDRAGITVADFTGLGVEDLFIAEACAAAG